MKKKPNKLSLLAIFALLSGATLGLVPAREAHAQSHPGRGRQKVGADLKEKTKRTKDNDLVDVMIQPSGAWTGVLDAALDGRKAVRRATFKNFAVRALKVKAKDVDAIASLPEVGYISLDREVIALGHVSLTTGVEAARTSAGGAPTYDGAGVGIAVFDSGIDTSHEAFLDGASAVRVVKSVDFTGEGRTDDPNGHGTHVASIAAGNGRVANGAYVGAAPNAKIINLRVLNSQGRGSVSALLSAIDWVKTNRATYNIRVVNMSLGTSATDSYRVDPLCLAVRSLVDSGVVVVAAAGNEGKDAQGNKIYGQIHAPGVDPSVITVGAVNTFGTDFRNDDGVATFSSRGPTRGYTTDEAGMKHYDNLIKPDLVAPGNKIVAAQAVNNKLVTQHPQFDANVSAVATKEQMTMSGTSMATPVVAGTVALMLQANPKLTPNMVKMILMYTAQQLPGFNTFEQGAGELNVEGAVRLARLVRTNLSATTAVGSSLLTGTAPAPQTTIAGWSFTWSQGLVLNQTFARGANLISKYQTVYGQGSLLGDGVRLNASGVMMTDGTIMTDGVILADNILTSTGSLLGDGIPFMSCSSLMGDGSILTDGSLMTDGTLLGDGSLMTDSVLLGD